MRRFLAKRVFNHFDILALLIFSWVDQKIDAPWWAVLLGIAPVAAFSLWLERINPRQSNPEAPK